MASDAWKFCAVAVLGFLGVSCIALPVAIAPSAQVEAVVYSPEGWPKEMRADVYRPKNSVGPAPAVLLLHGGGLKGTGGRWQMNGIAGKLVRRGYVVVNATYRTIPEFKYPAPEQDVREALHWMRRNAGQYGIDPDRIAIFGYSAGGYLASLTALKDDAKRGRVKAIVAGGAPSDMIFYTMGALVPGYLGGRLYEVPERFYAASPANFVKHDSPPIFMYHGEKDKLVRPEHPLLMQEAYQHAGAKSEIRWLPGLGHIGTFIFSDKAVDEAIDFLDRELR